MFRSLALLLLPLSAGAIPTTDLKLVAGGIVQGFLSDKPDLKTCITGADGTLQDVEQAVKDFEKKTAAGILDGLKELSVAMKAFPGAMKECKATAADVESIVNALKQIHTPKEFAFHLGHDLVVNHRDIYTEITTAVTDYRAQKYEDFGVQVGLALHKLIVGADSQLSQVEGISGADMKLVAGGIVEGFLSDKADIKTCITGTEQTLEDVEDAVKDFEKKTATGMLDGLKALSGAMKAFPAALTACKATVADVESIVNALKQIHTPKEFVFHVGHDLVVNHHDIYNEITTAVTDYKAQKYEDFGVQVGQALHKLIVGVDNQLSKVEGISGTDLKLVAGGIVEGFLSDKADIKTCITGTEQTLEDVEDAVKDFEKKTAAGMLDGLKALSEAMKAFPAALTACKATVADVESIVNALKQIKSPKEFAFHVAKDLVVNGHNIYNEIMTAVTDFKAQKYEDFGIQVGMALHKLIVGTDEKFSEFEKHFQRKWNSLEERLAAKLAFAKNLINIKQLNAADEGTAVYSHLTPFADLSPEEFSLRLGLKPNMELEAAPVADLLDVSDLPASFDWREKGAVNAVKNQGGCGSCWAFATVANIEGAGFVTTGKLVSLSEQELVDCDKKTGDEGCQGGLPSNAYKDMVDNKVGLVLESAYPYTGRSEKCTLQASQEKAFITGWQAISKDEDQIAAAVVKFGPLSIGINAGPMQWYFGGIANPWTIFCNPNKIDHGVAIVGFGVEGSKKFWIIRNSWGATWGEKGYYRIVRGVNKCGLTTMVATATGITIKDDQIVV